MGIRGGASGRNVCMVRHGKMSGDKGWGKQKEGVYGKVWANGLG